ncbi:MAG: hypothetical protein M3N91_01540 [Pseudomonadota bacterium]|nr:hypothetical protein [Pseudomonadota bacterium]
MSEVDGLSNSGLYPVLPLGDRRTSKDDKERRQRSDQGPDTPASKSADTPNTLRPPKSQIDEYA